MRKMFFWFLFISISLSATVVNYTELPIELQKKVVPDMEGRVLLSDDDTFLTDEVLMSRDLPTVVELPARDFRWYKQEVELIM